MPLEIADCLTLADDQLLRALVPAAGQQLYSRAGELSRGQARWVALAQQVTDIVRPILAEPGPAGATDLAQRLAEALTEAQKVPAPLVPPLAVLLARHGLPQLPDAPRQG